MANPIQKLHSLGQSLWYDNIQRRMLENGELKKMIQNGDLRGMTSNPSIFNHAIAKSNDYNAALKPMAWSGYNAGQILDQLVIEDIRAAADLFLPLYEESRKGDGYVSIEVGPEAAYDTKKTLAEAQRLWKWAAHPNVMVKIPATKEGIPAIRQAIADGININITLIFSINRYIEVMDAYMSGLEERLKKGLPIDQIASVASFFVSRIDSKVDQRLEEIIKEEGPEAARAGRLLGKIAIANAKLAYAQFRATFETPRFSRLHEHGARLQRPLWASTSTKNPNYPDTMYVDELIGPDTINTVPPQTLEAFREHGTAKVTVEDNLDGARQDFEDLADLGISIDQVTKELEDEGVKAFSDAFTSLLKTVDERRKQAVAELGPLDSSVPGQVAELDKSNASRRMQQNDPDLWTKDPQGQEEIRKRLGWLALPYTGRDKVAELREFCDQVRGEGYSRVLLLGMGGSSLAPEVLRLVFYPEKSPVEMGTGLDLKILDSTDPAQVQAAANWATPVDKTLFVVSSKSGGTAEVNAFLDYFWELANKTVGNHAGEHFVVITDPGTSLEKLAKERNFRTVFLSDPKVGGRYSALTLFGLLPAALLGLDLDRLLDKAEWMAQQCKPDVPTGRNPGLVLGAVLGDAVLHGRDKLTLFADPGLESFGSWLEQLLAESSGKENRTGIVPVDAEPLAEDLSLYGSDRLFVYLCKEGKYDPQATRLKEAGQPVITLEVADDYSLAADFFRWEIATAIACAVLKVNPFDQPNVQDSKTRTVKKIDDFQKAGKLDEGQPLWENDGICLYGSSLPVKGGSLKGILEAFLDQAKPGDYVAINAYLPRDAHFTEELTDLRVAIRQRTRLATTVGFGPRFQHSTGQLHKGGKNNGVFLQITAEPVEDIPIPGEGLTFGQLERAQALGDLEALQVKDRRALRIQLPRPESLAEILKLLQ